MLERFENVGIRLRIATENLPEEWDHQSQISKIRRAPQRIFRFAELQHEQSPTGFAHPMHFRQTHSPVAQIAQTITNRHNVERIVRIRQILRVPNDEMGVLTIGIATPFPGEALSGDRQHRFAEIDSDGLSSSACQRESHVARAATNVQRPFS